MREHQTGFSARRLLAVDQMRGLVMVLMMFDHASEWLNKGRFVTDAAWFWKPGTPIPADQFLLRWVTHLCAPTFVFLAGVGIALSTAKRRAQGDSERAIDRTLALRGLIIMALELFWMTPVMMEGKGILLQVLYAIGVSMVLMVLLRRLPARVLGVSALTFFALSELAINFITEHAHDGAAHVAAALLMTGGVSSIHMGPLARLIVAYPALHWLAIMALGHACAGVFARTDRDGKVERVLFGAGLGALAIFALVRGLNGYGNMQLLRDDPAPLQWLHVSKYPPSITYLTLELGLMSLLLAGFYRLERKRAADARSLGRVLAALTVLGQAALFYYVIHLHFMAAASWLLGIQHQGGVGLTLLGGALTVLVLRFPVARYQRYKTAHPNSWTRYL